MKLIMILGFALIIGVGVSNKLASGEYLFSRDVNVEKTRTDNVEVGQLPVYCKPFIIKEMIYAWQNSKNGWAKDEFGFITYRKSDNTDGLTRLPYTGQYKEITFKLSKTVPEGARMTGIFHTHPNFEGAKPSTDDKAMSDMLRVPIYVISKDGLNVYYPQTSQTIELRRYMDWIKPCSEYSAN